MARNFSELRKGISRDRRSRNEQRAAAILAAMELPELRDYLAVTQHDLADRLSISQSNVSRLERRADMHISTLREWVAALGGELQLLAVFPDGAVELDQFAGRAV